MESSNIGGQGRGGDIHVIPLEEADFCMCLVAIVKITAKPTKFMSLTLVGFRFCSLFFWVFFFLLFDCPFSVFGVAGLFGNVIKFESL